MVELLTERGFTLDRRKQQGNIHFEEYWWTRCRWVAVSYDDGPRRVSSVGRAPLL